MRGLCHDMNAVHGPYASRQTSLTSSPSPIELMHAVFGIYECLLYAASHIDSLPVVVGLNIIANDSLLWCWQCVRGGGLNLFYAVQKMMDVFWLKHDGLTYIRFFLEMAM